MKRRRLRLLAVGLVSTLTLGACSLLSGGEEPAGPARPAPGHRRSRAARGSRLPLGARSLLGGADEPAGTAAPAPVDRPFELAGVCPNPVVIQTDWYPESEYGATYNLVGDGYKVDTKRKLVRGPMVVD